MRALLLLLIACTPADKNAGRSDVQEFMRTAQKNGHRVVLDGDTIQAFDCKSEPRHFPPIPTDMTLECVDGYTTRWKRDGPRS